MHSALSSAYASAKKGRSDVMLISIIAHIKRLSRVYLNLRIAATAVTMVWAAAFSYAIWDSRFDKDKRERLTAVNDLWLGSRSGVLFALIAHWAFTIAMWYMTPLFGTVIAAAIEYLRFHG